MRGLLSVNLDLKRIAATGLEHTSKKPQKQGTFEKARNPAATHPALRYLVRRPTTGPSHGMPMTSGILCRCQRLIELQVIQGCILIACLQKLIMRSTLNNSATRHNHDAVGSAYG